MARRTVKVDAELDAASALLQLQFDQRDFPVQDTSPIGVRKGGRHSMPEFRAEVPAVVGNGSYNSSPQRGPLTFKFTVTAGDSKRISTPSPPNQKQIVKLPNGGMIIRNSKPEKSRAQQYKNRTPTKNLTPSNKKLNLHKKYLQEQRRWAAECKAKIKAEKTTCDTFAQTEHELSCQALSKLAVELTDKINELKEKIAHIKKSNSEGTTPCGERSNSEESNPPHRSSASSRSTSGSADVRRSQKKSYNGRIKTPTTKNAARIVKEEPMSEDDDDDQNISNRKQNLSQSSSAHVRKSTVKTELVPIGEGHAKVPLRLMKQLNWSSYTSATRKLLTAVFSRKVLATHSLSGKPSPAFPNKPAKKRLNASLVNDIVLTVLEYCSNVTEGHVRSIITTKCADESKMLRSRLQNKIKRRLSKKENFAPDDASISEDSSP